MIPAVIIGQKVWKWEAWAGQTTSHPLAIAVLVALAGMVLLGRRQHVAVYFLALGMFVPQAQRVVVAGLDFDFMRILTIVGVVRVVVKSEWSKLSIGPQELLLGGFVVTSIVGATVRTGGEEFVNRLGFALDAVGLYLVFRCVIRSGDDFLFLLRGMAVFAAVVFGFFILERSTGRNIFSIFGGVPEVTVVRNGRLRCQGAFSHAILAGVFMSTLAVWFLGAILGGRALRWGPMGVLSSIGVIALTASSTPVSALLIGIVGWCAFPLRRWFSLGLLAICPILVLLHFSMNNGIFHLFARIDFVGGSTGWHRYFLMDRAMANIHEWWLTGVDDTSHWGEGLYDVTNQYVLEGVRGGLLPMIFLVAMIVRAFLSIAASARSACGKSELLLVYSLGVSMFVHSMVFFSVSYFGQSVMLWYLTLAMAENSRLWWASAARSGASFDRIPQCARLTC